RRWRTPRRAPRAWRASGGDRDWRGPDGTCRRARSVAAGRWSLAVGGCRCRRGLGLGLELPGLLHARTHEVEVRVLGRLEAGDLERGERRRALEVEHGLAQRGAHV